MNNPEEPTKKKKWRPLSHSLWEITDSILHTSDEVRIEFRNRIAAYLTAAFGLVAGLAWNDAIKSLIAYWFPAEVNTIMIKFLYAIGITIVFVLVSILIISTIKIEKEGEKKEEKEKKTDEEKSVKKASKIKDPSPEEELEKIEKETS